MEPLSAVASIIALIQCAGKIGSLIYGYIGRLKRVPDEVQQLVDELHSLEKVLMTLHNYVKTSSCFIQPGLQHLTALSGQLHACSQVLGQLASNLERTKIVKTRKYMWAMKYPKWPLGGKGTRRYISSIEKQKYHFELIITTDRRSLPGGIESGLDSVLALQDLPAESAAPVSFTLSTLDTVGHEEERKQIHAWYRLSEFDRHLDIRHQRQKQTGDWLLKDPRFQGWVEKRQRSQLLWVHGLPGAGKTFLTSMVIDHLEALASNTNCGVAYIYFNYQDHDQQEHLHILASLVEQLARQRPHLFATIRSQYGDYKRPTLNELYSIILEATKSFHRVFFVLDALDECDQNQRKVLLPLFRRMEKDGISFFLTSRPQSEDIQDFLRDVVEIEISSKVGGDIKVFIQQMIDQDPRGKRLVEQSKQGNRIIARLTRCAKGMFLLARFQCDYICQQTNSNQVLAALERIESDSTVSLKGPLDLVYDRATENIYRQGGSYAGLAINILSWLVRARRALTVAELQTALSVKTGQYRLDEFDLPDKTILLGVCAGLVTVGEYSNTIRLAHYTVHDYLLANPIIAEENADLKLATACLTYLTFDSFNTGVCKSRISPQDCKPHSFLDYAAHYLSSHLRSCDENLTILAVLKFLASPGNVSTYLQALHAGRDLKNHYEEDGPFWDYERNEHLRLHVASAIGHHKVVQLLLEGARISIPDNDGWNILSQAKSSGHDAVAALLLGNKADSDLTAKDNYGQTALHVAASKGHDTIVRLLLEKGADLSASDKIGQTVLHKAAWGGHERVVQLLLDGGADTPTTGHADISTSDKDGNTALCLAVSGGYEGVIKVLIENGADIPAMDYEGWELVSPLELGGFEAVVQMLLANRVDPPGRRTSPYITAPGNKVLAPAPQADWRSLLSRWVNIQSIIPTTTRSNKPASPGGKCRPIDDYTSLSTHHLSDDEWGDEEEGYRGDEMCSAEGESNSDDDDSPYFNSYSEFGTTYCAGSRGGAGKRKADFFQEDSGGQSSFVGGSQNNDQDGTSDRPGRRKKRNGGQAPISRSMDSQGPSYACPYFKNDAEKYVSCANWNANTTHRVKEHIKRRHLKPRQCLRCGTFRAGDQGQIDAHLQGVDCEKVMDIAPVEGDVLAKSKALQMRSLNWGQIYIILFPGCDIPDPYWQGLTETIPAPESGVDFPLPLPQASSRATLDVGFAGYIISQMPRLLVEFNTLSRGQSSDNEGTSYGLTPDDAHHPLLQQFDAQNLIITPGPSQASSDTMATNNTAFATQWQPAVGVYGSNSTQDPSYKPLPVGHDLNFPPTSGSSRNFFLVHKDAEFGEGEFSGEGTRKEEFDNS